MADQPADLPAADRAGPSTGGPVPPGPVAPLVTYAVLAVTDLVGVALRLPVLEWIGKPLLAPALAWYLLRAGRPVRDPIVVGLALACLGDVALLLRSPVAFLAGVLAFLGTQLSYRHGLRRYRRNRGPAANVGYLGLWLVVGSVLLVRLGPFALPLVGYGLALVSMAIAAAAVSTRTGVGAAIFVASDLMIGLGAAGVRAPGAGLAVMLTYITAQALIVTGYRYRVDTPHPPGPRF